MANIRDVAAYILAQRGPMSAFKLQKLCYYSQAWSLVWDDRPLFDARIEAWANGPVAPSLYAAHKGMYTIHAGQLGGAAETLCEFERETIDVVLSSYGDLSGQQLSDLTHAEEPWLKARARAGLGPMDRGDAEITHEDMYVFYETVRVANDRTHADGGQPWRA